MRENPVKTKHKRCWFCGHRYNVSHRKEVHGRVVDVHKACWERDNEENARSNNAFGMER